MNVLFYPAAAPHPELLLAALEDPSYDLEVVDDAELAFQRFASKAHSLVVLDARKDAPSAIELCRRIRSQADSSPQILALVDDDALAGDLVAAGIDDLIDHTASAWQVEARLRLASHRASAQTTSLAPAVRPQPAPGDRRFERLVELSPDMVALHARGEWLFVNRAGIELLAATSAQDLVGQPIANSVDDAPSLLEDRSAQDAAALGPAVPVEEGVLRRLDGSKVAVEFVSLPSTFQGTPATQVMIRDITPRKRAEDALRRSERRYRELFEGIPVGVYRMSPRGVLRNFNRALVELMGYPDRVQMHGLDSGELYRDPKERERWRKLMVEHGRVDDFETQIRRHDGQVIWVRSTAQEIRDQNDQLLGYEATAEDITDRKTVEERLIHDALHDSLTELPNRVLFMDRLDLALGQRARNSRYRCAVLFLDLDRFKMVNDSFGHAIGDQLLIQASRRLRSCLRPTDTLARLGGDEFAILLDDVRDASNAVRVAKRVQKELRSPFHLDSWEVYSSTSIGIALSSSGDQTPAELLRDADIAMYRAKQKGRAGYSIFDAEMHEQVRLQLSLETDFRRAVEDSQLEVFYQPIVDLQARRVAGFEALLRWRHPKRGLVTPGEFLPLAEETGLINLLGRQALDEACRQAERWNAQGWVAHPLYVSVNLSPSQFAQHDLLRQVEVALKQGQLDPALLHLEVNERATMVHPEAVLTTLQYIKELGVHLCLDNFGTGYSSLSVLHRFPFDSVKIDRWFVREVERDQGSAELVEGILALCHWRNLETLAQGIETEAQQRLLSGMKCLQGQGFLFSEAIPAAQIESFLTSDVVARLSE